MSRENVVVVRQPVTLRQDTRRGLEERLALRFPRALAPLVRAVFRLPPRSRFRQLFVRRVVQLGFEALNRGDNEPAFVLYHPEVELILPQEFVGLGLPAVVRGRKERECFEWTWIGEWGQVLYDFEEIIDLGDGRGVVVGRIKGSGPSSEAAFDNEFVEIFTFSAGRVIREEAFFDRAEALEAVGLRE
jgi:ketosteroid isomerase-like protein